jgi:hypothetical protein
VQRVGQRVVDRVDLAVGEQVGVAVGARDVVLARERLGALALAARDRHHRRARRCLGADHEGRGDLRRTEDADPENHRRPGYQARRAPRADRRRLRARRASDRPRVATRPITRAKIQKTHHRSHLLCRAGRSR